MVKPGRCGRCEGDEVSVCVVPDSSYWGESDPIGPPCVSVEADLLVLLSVFPVDVPHCDVVCECTVLESLDRSGCRGEWAVVDGELDLACCGWTDVANLCHASCNHSV